MRNTSVYLVGAMSAFYYSGEYERATDWRKYANSKLSDTGILVFDPTNNSHEHFNFPKEYNGGVIFQNYTYLTKCDVLLVNLDKFDDSIGSIWEVGVAWEHHKPVVAFGTCDKWSNRPHFQSLFTAIFDDVESACDYIISLYSQKI